MSSKDKTIRSIFDEVPQRLSEILAPASIKELLPTTFPSSELMVDFLAIFISDAILHIKFQPLNNPKIAERTLQYLTYSIQIIDIRNIDYRLLYHRRTRGL